MLKLTQYFFVGVPLCFIFIIPRLSRSADTAEPFDVGAMDFELYTGVEGLGHGKYKKTVFGEVVLGVGLLPRWSAYLGTTLEANEYFANGAVGFAMGTYGTLVDTHHFDFDLFLEFSGGVGDFSVTPSIELNIDGDAEMGSAGVYLRSGVAMYGRDGAEEGALEPEEPEEPEFEFVTQIDGTVGSYVTIGERHQLLLEFDMAFRPDTLDDEHKSEVGGIALGYNVMLTDGFELIHQVYLDVPQGDEQTAWGFSIGMLATLPSGG